jgi:hypothetical protein
MPLGESTQQTRFLKVAGHGKARVPVQRRFPVAARDQQRQHAQSQQQR